MSRSRNSTPATATVETDSSDFANLAAKREGIASTGKARPFPTDIVADLDDAEPKPAAAQRQVAQRSAKNPLAAATAGVRRNPLIEEEPVEPEAEVAAAPRSKLATGREIAILLNKAKAAGELGEFDEAKSYALAASDLAEQCSYEFTSREASPETVVKWIENRESSELQSRPSPQRRAIAATRRPRPDLAATTTAFSKPSAKQVFADEVEESTAVAETSPPERRRPIASKESSFNQWAAGVGTEPVARPSSPEWPVLSTRELAASDDLWQPSRSEFEHSLGRLRGNPVAGRTSRQAETHLASAESDAPMFVATAEAHEARHVASAARTKDPLVQLGLPTDLAPGADTTNARSGLRRGPRLATPPPLSIEEAGEPKAVAKVRSPKTSRTIWFAVVGGLALLTLVVFRRWAYRTPAATAESPSAT
jgi:hypothetical protein